jgi:hypothetical protein
VFNYIEHEARFQAAAATATGAAAAWWLEGLLTPGAVDTRPTHPLTSRIAASLLALAAFLFLVTEGRISADNGQLALQLAQHPAVIAGTLVVYSLSRAHDNSSDSPPS